MKYRKFILLAAFAACGVLASAQQVGYEAAKDIAASFITVKKGSPQTGNLVVYQQYTKYDSQGNPLLYIFNFEGGGFVIVSADKNAEPILAYSATNKFSMEGENPAAESWVNAYAEGIAYAVETNAVPTAELVSKWAAAERGDFSSKTQKATSVKPLLTSKWNQDKYYNTLCPDTIAGGSCDNHTYNGCVAVAMAQIMYYHRYPATSLNVNYNYVHPRYGIQTAKANTKYDYQAMSDIATGYSNAIAVLCYHAGVSVKMNYAADGSGAYVDDAKNAFSSRFTYKSTLRVYDKGDDESWKILLKTDLNMGLPIFYAANTGGTGVHAGHAFVCDGYDENDMFHFNWGWGGNSDDYYSLSNMMGFRYNHQIITGIEPFRETMVSTGSDTLTATYGSFTDGSMARVNYACYADRSWLIAPQNGRNVTKIILKTAYFATEPNNDVVTIYSGGKADADSIIARLSGNLDTSIVIEASRCFVTFTSNATTTARGFKFNYTSTRKSDNLCPAQIPSTSNFQSESQGSITSNEGLYEDENTCYWAVKPKDNQVVGVKFTKFELEEGDMVELYTWNGTVQPSTLRYWTNGKYRFTKQNPPELGKQYLVMSVGAFVRFRTDNNLNGNGFELDWYTADAVTEAQVGMANVSVFPNPARSVLNIEIETVQPEPIQLIMSNILGQTVYASEPSQPEPQFRKEIDISTLAQGVYFLKIATSQGNIVRKVIVSDF